MASAGKEQSDEQVLVLRPRRLRLIVIIFSPALSALMAFGWFTLPREIRLLFTPSQLLTLLGILGLIIFVLATAAASYVRADAAGLRIRNGLRRHDVPWSRVHKIILRAGDPWAQVLLKPADGRPFEADFDAEKRQLMGIQASDGPAAREAVEQLRQRQQSYRSAG
jgi:PH (Pleckstrin Homology) domain-containing protein